MKIKVFLAVLACKCCRSLIRLLGRGGTDFPGRVALKICPNLLGELAKGVTTVIVTGTNGKTTTSRMIEQSWCAFFRGVKNFWEIFGFCETKQTFLASNQ